MINKTQSFATLTSESIKEANQWLREHGITVKDDGRMVKVRLRRTFSVEFREIVKSNAPVTK